MKLYVDHQHFLHTSVKTYLDVLTFNLYFLIQFLTLLINNFEFLNNSFALKWETLLASVQEVRVQNPIVAIKGNWDKEATAFLKERTPPSCSLHVEICIYFHHISKTIQGKRLQKDIQESILNLQEFCTRKVIR